MPDFRLPAVATCEPVSLAYEADLLGNIQQALAGLQGFGVMALEIIQNADDAGALSLSFDVTDDALYVQNSAAFTTCGLQAPRCPWESGGAPDGTRRSCNFHAISRMGSRNKIHVTSQIGRFGIGFVSVYQITDSPIIRSAGVEMRLDPVLGEGVTRAIPPSEGTEFVLPWASMVSDTRKALNASPTPGDVVPLVVEAIEEMLVRGLFFLRNLRHVELRKNGRAVTSVAIARENDIVRLQIEPGGRSEKWMLLSRDAGDLAEERSIYEHYPTLVELGRSSIVTVAVPLHAEDKPGLLYAFLPTEQRSGLPLHINGDFFPHPTRRMVTLSGEQHERYWNELLLDTAAKAIAENFDAMRDLLGFERLWALAGAAFAIRETASFQSFWIEIQIAAKASESVRTVDERWCTPAECHLPDLDAAGQSAIAAIGLSLLHERLRPHWNVLQALGASPLRLSAVVAALERLDELDAFVPDIVHLPPLWRAVDAMMAPARAGSDLDALIARLKSIAFILDNEGNLATINQLWRAEEAVPPADIRTFLADCPLVHEQVLGLPALTAAIDLYQLDDFARGLAAEIVDEESAARVIGTAPGDAARFYSLLIAFKVDPSATKADAILADIPILKSGARFVAPSRGRLPGGFTDPIGHFELIDTAEMPEKMHRLARDILRVVVLTFDDYVKDHLEDILAGEPGQNQYVALLGAILEHRAELDSEGTLQTLAEIEFVRTRAGHYVRPSQCYYWTAQLETLLGPDGEHWVDENWMPTGRGAARFQDLLENRLGMRRLPAIAHLAERIEAIATSRPIDAIAIETQPIVRYILDQFSRLGPKEREALERLRTLPWLPGSLSGERIQGTRFAPSALYRSFRSAGFASQAKIVDLPILRGAQGGRALTEFLDFLQLPEEPPTEAIVAHLEHCMKEELPASDVIYAMLSERVGSEDADCIDRLADKAFIYDSDLKRYYKSDRIFWNHARFGGHWHLASLRMRGREPLYRRLGVEDEPAARHHAALLLEIASQAVPSPEDIAVHERCLAWLADALDRNGEDIQSALEMLQGMPALLNIAGEPVWPDEAIWLDSDALAQPFDGALDERLVAPPAGPRHVTARLFRELEIRQLSEIARLRLAAPPESSEDEVATVRLQERAELLLWLAPNAAFRDRLKRMLSGIRVHAALQLQVQAEITEYEPAVRSPSIAAPAFYDPEAGILYRKGEAGAAGWPAAFHALFAPFEQLSYGTDMKPVIITAAYLVSLGSALEAEQALRNADYRPPEDEFVELNPTDRITDAEEDPTDADQEEEATEEDFAPNADRGNPDAEQETDSADEVDDDEPDEHGDSDAEGRTDRMDEDPQADTDPDDASGELDEQDGGFANDDDPFRSKAVTGEFGAESGQHTGTGKGTPGQQPGWGWGSKRSRTRGPTTRERQERRSRMLTYVNAGKREGSGERDGSDAEELSDQIDMAAIDAVLKYEAQLGRDAVEQPHNNPGYDIISSARDGPGRRLIEVKGLEGEWTERGVKLSRVQYANAQQYGSDYWIYVVERARDLQKRQVYAIANPFSKVEEYWFDHGWRDAIDETATAGDMNLTAGAKIRHAVWGVGTIEEVNRRGAGVTLRVDFGMEGRKLIPLNSNLEFVD